MHPAELYTINICDCNNLSWQHCAVLRLTWHIVQEDELKDSPVKHGGVLTPASAMGMVLVRRLQNAGVSFTVQ